VVRVTEGCDACGEAVSDALARTVRLTVDRSQIDVQRLCPTCFADWVNRYDSEMRQRDEGGDDGDTIIVD
jgi:hypothetical protein